MTLKKFLSSKNILILVLALIVFISLLINKKIQDENLFSIGKYTYGTITDIKAMKGGLVYYYDFKLNGYFYEGNRRSGRLKKKGDRCFIIFNPNNYDDNKMLLLLPLVPDSIMDVPVNGWKKLPISLDEELIKKSIK